MSRPEATLNRSQTIFSLQDRTPGIHPPPLTLPLFSFAHALRKRFKSCGNTTVIRCTDACYLFAAGFRARPLAFPRALGAASVRSSPAASLCGWTDGSSSPELPAKQWQIRHKIPMNIWSGPPALLGNLSRLAWRE